jgi:small-conductance mechanosensitive channel
MTMEFSGLLPDVWRDIQQTDTLWQLAVLLVCLSLAWLINRWVKDRPEGDGRVWQIGQDSLRRITFPVASLLMVMMARPTMEYWMPTPLLNLAIPLLGSLAIIRAVLFILRRSFRQAAWLAPFERSFTFLVWAVVALHIVGLLPQVIEFFDEIAISVGKQRLSLWLLLQGAATVLTTVLLALWLGSLAESRLMAAQGLDANLRVVFSRLTSAILVILAVLIGLPLVGIDLTTLSVFGGALGVGIGLGLQKIASNYVAGFIILLDRSIRLGNVIQVGSERGEVTQITTRYTVLKNSIGAEAIIPNEMLIGSVVLNETLTDSRLRLALQVQIGYDSNVDTAMRLVCQAAAEQGRVLVDPPPKAFLTSFGESAINLELGFWVADPEEGTQQLRSDINMAIWQAFQTAGVTIPYPMREVRISAVPTSAAGVDSSGQAGHVA